MTTTSDAEEPEAAAPPPYADLIDAIAKAADKYRRGIMDDEHDARTAANVRWAEALESEFAPTIAGLFGALGDPGSLPDGVAALFKQGTDPEHQFGLIVQIAMAVGWLLAIVPAVGRPAVQGWVNQAWTNVARSTGAQGVGGYPSVPVSPADAADAVERNIYTEEEGSAQAARSGVSDTDFQTLVALTGEPPGVMDFLKLWLRGAATQAETEHAIKYSRIRDEFIPYVLQMAYTQMSPADAVEVAIKQILSDDDAKALFIRGGGLDGDWPILVEAAGNSIGPAAAMNLWNHGLINETEVDQALSRSRLNPMFYDVAKLTRHKWLGVIQIEALIKAGQITPAEAQAWMLADGYPVDQATALSNLHGTTGTTKAHGETESMVTSFYEDQLLSRDEAMAALTGIGYTGAVADLILTNADAKRAQAQTTRVVGAVRVGYVDARMTRTEAVAKLDALHIPPAARDAWLDAWDIEASTRTKQLSDAVLGALGKKGEMAWEEVVARYISHGYDPADARLLAIHYGWDGKP